jgi:SAM-dependent methyltransferase
LAIDRGTARLLLEEDAKRPFYGSILQLGRQTILFSENQLRSWAKRAGVDLAQPTNAAAERASQLACQALTGFSGGALDDGRFFRFLGFDHVVSCDASSYESASLLLDLNQPVPTELHGKFDVVFNGGTMEHVFDVPCVLRNIHSMLKVGGRAIHIAPSSNMIDHGFYSFSPSLFCDYYQANRYQVLTVYLFECVSWTGEWSVYDVSSAGLDNRLGKMATSKMAGVFCVAQRTADSISAVAPIQNHFSRAWERSPQKPTTGLIARAKGQVKHRYPRIAEAMFWTRALIWRLFSRRSSMPRLLGKY